MPIVTIQVTGDPVTKEQKDQLIRQSTDMLVDVLNKDPKNTWVLIEEIATENWGIDGKNVTHLFKNTQKQKLLAKSS